jgi:hypothetical protein
MSSFVNLNFVSFFPCPEPVFVNLLRSLGIDSQPGGPVLQPYLSYRPARLHRLTESIPGLHKSLRARSLYSREIRIKQGDYFIHPSSLPYFQRFLHIFCTLCLPIFLFPPRFSASCFDMVPLLFSSSNYFTSDL